MSTTRETFAESRGKHDHRRCVSSAIKTAERICKDRKLQLTPIRRRVLELVWSRHAPIRAYDILSSLKRGDGALAPPTVYRALDFLLEAGLIHRIDSLNAFVGCETPEVEHASQFMVCLSCNRVQELDDPAIARVLRRKAKSAGFVPQAQSIEIKGICGACAKED